MSQRITFCAGLWVEVVISYLSGLQPVQHIWVVQGRSGALRERNSEREILQYLLFFLVHLVDWQRQLVDPGANHDSVRLWPGLRSFLICVCWEGTLPIRPHQLLFHHIYPNTMQNCLVSVLLFLLFFFFFPITYVSEANPFPIYTQVAFSNEIHGTYYFVDGIRKMPLGNSVSRETNIVIMKLQEAR